MEYCGLFQVKFTNHSDKPIEEICMKGKKETGGMKIQEFPEIGKATTTSELHETVETMFDRVCVISDLHRNLH